MLLTKVEVRLEISSNAIKAEFIRLFTYHKEIKTIFLNMIIEQDFSKNFLNFLK